MGKSSKHIVSQRIIEISGMLIKGYSRDSILQNTSELWNVSDRQIDTYICKARELIENSIKRKVEYDYAQAVRRYEELYKHSFEEKDYRACLSINKELTALQGLNKIQVEHSGNVEFICNIPD